MKKLISLLFLLMIASNVSFAGELGEDAAADCISTHQSGRFQETLVDGAPAEAEQSGQSTVR